MHVIAFRHVHYCSKVRSKKLSTKNKNLLIIYSPSVHSRCRWVCFFIGTGLEKFNIASLAHQWILCSEWVPSQWEPSVVSSQIKHCLQAKTVQNISKQIYWWMWKDNREWIYSLEEALFWIMDCCFGQNRQLFLTNTYCSFFTSQDTS